MKRSETILVGAALIVGGIAIFVGLGLGKLDTLNTANSQIDSLNNEIKSQEDLKTTLNANIAALENNTKEPIGVNVRKFNDKNQAEVIKALLDGVFAIASGTGNNFISLLPGKDEPPPPKTADTPAQAATDSNQPVAPPPPVLRPFRYDLAIRGTYDTLQDFLRRVSEQKELIEISKITIENEAGADRSAVSPSPDKVVDPVHPLKLTASLTIYLQPE